MGFLNTLSGGGASLLSGLLGGNSSSSTNGSQSSNSTGTTSGNSSGVSTTTPNIPSWYSSFLQSLPGMFSQQMSQAQTPLLGNSQIASYMNGVNQTFGGANQTLLSQLAKNGQLNSGAGAQAQTGLQLGKLSNINNYLSQVPVQNATFSQQYGNPLLSTGMGFSLPVSAYGSTSTNSGSTYGNTSSNSNSSNQSTTKQGSGLLGKL
jgi:hypothetical protein